MTKTIFFYDLETSGFNPREERIMQFAGQRVDLNLKPIGKPINYLIKMTSGHCSKSRGGVINRNYPSTNDSGRYNRG